MLLLTMLFACGEKEATTNAVSTTTTEVVETKTMETTDEKTTDNTVEVTKDVNDITSGESKTEVTTTSTETNEGVTND
jgi:phosphopantetheinyl transferase (holo-ACP synthase)